MKFLLDHDVPVDVSYSLKHLGHRRSIKRRLVLVCFAARGTKIRIISARKATRIERKDYEENVSS